MRTLSLFSIIPFRRRRRCSCRLLDDIFLTFLLDFFLWVHRRRFFSALLSDNGIRQRLVSCLLLLLLLLLLNLFLLLLLVPCVEDVLI